jgi:hypothetical protein
MYNAGSEEGNLEGHFNNRESSKTNLRGLKFNALQGPLTSQVDINATQGPELSIRKEPPNNSEASPMFWDLAC